MPAQGNDGMQEDRLALTFATPVNRKTDSGWRGRTLILILQHYFDQLLELLI